MPSTKLHKFALIVVAGVVDPGPKQRGQLQHGLLQVSTCPPFEFHGVEGFFISPMRNSFFTNQCPPLHVQGGSGLYFVPP